MAAASGRPPRMPLVAMFPNRQGTGGPVPCDGILPLPTDSLHHCQSMTATQAAAPHGCTGTGLLGTRPMSLSARPGSDIHSCQQDSSLLGSSPSQKAPPKGSPPLRCTMRSPPTPTSVGTHSVPISPPEPQRRSTAPQGDPLRLFVGFIPPHTSKESLLERFCIFGEISYCKVIPPKPGASSTYGFVQFAQKHSAQTALRALDNTLWDDLRILVEPAISSPPRPKPSSYQPSTPSGVRNELHPTLPCTVYVKRLPLTATEDSLKKLFGQVGNVKNAWMAKVFPRAENLSGFVQFHSMEEAGRALDQLNGVKLGLHKIVVELAYAAVLKSSAGGAGFRPSRSELERVKTQLVRVEPLEGKMLVHGGTPGGPPKVAKHTSYREDTDFTEEVVLSYAKMSPPCLPLDPEPANTKTSVVPGRDLIDEQQLTQGGGPSTSLLLASVVPPDSGIQSQVCTSNPTSTCSSPVQAVGGKGRDPVESKLPSLLKPTPRGRLVACGGGVISVEYPGEAERRPEKETTLDVGKNVQVEIGMKCPVTGAFIREDDHVDLCLSPQEDTCDRETSEPLLLEVPSFQMGANDSPGSHCTVPSNLNSSPRGLSLGSGGDRSPVNTRESLPGAQPKPPLSGLSGMGRGQRLSRILNMLPQVPPQTIGGQIEDISVNSPHEQEYHFPPSSEVSCEEDGHSSASDTDSPPPLTTSPKPVLAKSTPREAHTTPARMIHPPELSVGAACSKDYQHESETAVISRALTATTTSQDQLSNSSVPPLLEGDGFLLRLPGSGQAGSSGDERDELERSIAQHERNTRRWQVETRRLKQKSAAIREELGREEVEEVEGLELFKDVSDEKIREFDQILEAHGKLASETERLKRRELNRELILMKARQYYGHDELALLEVTHELEAKDARDKLSLVKLENVTLQRTAEYMA